LEGEAARRAARKGRGEKTFREMISSINRK